MNGVVFALTGSEVVPNSLYSDSNVEVEAVDERFMCSDVGRCVSLVLFSDIVSSLLCVDAVSD